ncbi:MAG TPA: ABC transporter permease, partial [Acidimicrobiales bacterium]|nr:ABC transporter permease [Acidimicrobiales bacterium]
MTTAAAPEAPVAMSRRATVVAIGNEVEKGLRIGWDERKQILLELAMFVPMFLLFAAVAGQGEQIVTGNFEWSFDDRRTGWLLVGFVLGMFFYLQAQKMFWRLLGEIQTGTLEQVHLSPLPSWIVAAAGRLLASLLETLAVVGTLYTVVALSVGVNLDWDPAVLAPVGFLVIGSVGYSLVIGALTLIWKRVEMLNDTLVIIVFFAGGMMVALDDMPGWIAAIGRLLPLTHPITAARSILLNGHGLTVGGDGGLVWMVTLAGGWLAFGAVAFHRADRKARRDGTLIRHWSPRRRHRCPTPPPAVPPPTCRPPSPPSSATRSRHSSPGEHRGWPTSPRSRAVKPSVSLTQSPGSRTTVSWNATASCSWAPTASPAAPPRT